MENHNALATSAETIDKEETKLRSKKKSVRLKFSSKTLQKELSNKPHVYCYILKLKKCLLKKDRMLEKLKKKLDKLGVKRKCRDVGSQTGEEPPCPPRPSSPPNTSSPPSLVEQVREAAQSAVEESGMVYEPTSGLYYDYNTGYYYNAELGLYYHTSTGCYYYFDKDTNEFVFHSQTDASYQHTTSPAPTKQKKNKTHRKAQPTPQEEGKETKEEEEIKEEEEEEEEGECSSSSQEEYDESALDVHPPCVRVIVQESGGTPGLRGGSLYLLTKEGGTLGREGTQHHILIPDPQVSRHHLTFSYDAERNCYTLQDMGSRNGTILNGKRMSAALQESQPMEMVHGSVIEVGSTKLLCHIHKGTTTCGHCEPGLLIKESPPKQVVRGPSLRQEHRREIQRLRSKYRLEGGEGDRGGLLGEGYEDKAKARRETVGSIHHGAKTEQASLDTCISRQNKGFKMLEKMGWQEGEGLGSGGKGGHDPVPLVSNVGTLGLGCAPTPLDLLPSAHRKPSLWLHTHKRFSMLPTPKAFTEDSSEEDGDA